MPTFEFAAPDGKSYSIEGPEGSTPEQAFSILQQQIGAGSAPATVEPSLAVKAGRALNDIPRQVGLTARYALEGPAEAAQIVTEPIRQFVTDPVMRLFGAGPSKPLGQVAASAADSIGLPTPQTPMERTVGSGTKLLAGGALIPAGAAAASSRAAPGATKAVLDVMASNPTQQLTGAAGAGMAGQASKEAGGNEWQQAGAALLGGLAGNFAPDAAGKVAGAVRSALAPTPNTASLDARLTAILQTQGFDYATVPLSARGALQAEMANAMRTGETIDPAALARLAAARSVPGFAPTRGMISQDPVQITREQNLAKIGANSNPANGLSGLARTQNENNAALLGNLNRLGASSVTDPVEAGRTSMSAIQRTSQALRDAEQKAWTAAKGSEGYTQPIYPDALNVAIRNLGDEGLMPFMDPRITNYMQAFQTGQQPFTPQAYRNLQSMLSKAMAAGGNEAAAAGVARRALEATPMRPITNPGGIDFGNLPATAQTAARMRAMDAQPGRSLDAVDAARAATRQAYQFEDSSPLVRSALHPDADPTRFASRFVIGGTPDEARTLAQNLNPAGRNVVRSALLTEIKNRATAGEQRDEFAKVTQAGLRKALSSIGEEKLALFFSPTELQALRDTSRAATMMQVQPVGSAVNNSNSGALIAGRTLDALEKYASFVPLGSALVKYGVREPVQAFQTTLGARNALNITPSLMQPRPAGPGVRPLLLSGPPALSALLAPGQE